MRKRRSGYLRATVTLLAFTACILFSSTLEAGTAEKALEYFKDDRFRDALNEINEVVKENPESGEGHLILGMIQFELTRLSDAQENFEKAKELDSDLSSTVASYLARIAFFLGDDDKCKGYLEDCDSDSWVTQQLPFFMAPPDLRSKRTKHYVVYADEDLAARGGLKYASHLMELVHDSYSAVFKFRMKDKLVHRVYVFSSDETYGQFNLRAVGNAKESAAGYFAPSTRTLVINADPESAEPNAAGFTENSMNTMFHEGFHQFIHMYAPAIPKWFNEGLAEYFGPSQYVPPRSLRVGVVRKTIPGGRYSRYERIMESIQNNQQIPFREFLTQNRRQFMVGDGNRALINYAQSWGFVHFLMHSKMKSQGRKMLKKYFAIMREGGTWKEAHKATFGKLNYAKTERMWIDYMKSL